MISASTAVEYSVSAPNPRFVTHAQVEPIGRLGFRVKVEASHPTTGEFCRQTVALTVGDAHAAAAQLSEEIYTIAVRVAQVRGKLEELLAFGVFDVELAARGLGVI